MELTTTYKQVENVEKNGIELYFDAIPSKSERDTLKANGFRWHSVKRCWYAKKDATQKEPIKLGKEPIENSYSGNGWRGINCDKYNITETAKIIKKELTARFSGTTWSVTVDRSTWSNHIYIALISSKENPFKEDVKQYRQLNQYYIDSDDSLSDYGKQVFQYAKDLSDSFNYDDSDSMTDYFDCGFYMTLAIGKWEKPFSLVA